MTKKQRQAEVKRVKNYQKLRDGMSRKAFKQMKKIIWERYV